MRRAIREISVHASPHFREYPIALMCRALEVSESGYHAWSKREVSQRAQEDQALADQIAQIFQANRGIYGSPRIHAELQELGRRCGRKRIAPLMRALGISAQAPSPSGEDHG